VVVGDERSQWRDFYEIVYGLQGQGGAHVIKGVFRDDQIREQRRG
jgi:hypothetical protein